MPPRPLCLVGQSVVIGQSVIVVIPWAMSWKSVHVLHGQYEFPTEITGKSVMVVFVGRCLGNPYYTVNTNFQRNIPRAARVLNSRRLQIISKPMTNTQPDSLAKSVLLIIKQIWLNLYMSLRIGIVHYQNEMK